MVGTVPTFPPPVLTGSGSTGPRYRVSALIRHPEVGHDLVWSYDFGKIYPGRDVVPSSGHVKARDPPCHF